MMKFLKKPAGFNTQWIGWEQGSRWSVFRFADQKTAFTDRKPRSDSQYWDEARFMVWDRDNNCQAKG